MRTPSPVCPHRPSTGDHHAPRDPPAQGNAGRDPLPLQSQPPPALRHLDEGRAPAGAGQGTGAPTPTTLPTFPDPSSSSSPILLSQLPGWSVRPDGSIVIATGNDDALGLYRCTPYNSYGTAGESRPTRVLLKVRSPSGSPLGSAPPCQAPPKLPLCLAGPSCLHGAAQGGIFPGGGPGAGDPLRGSRGSAPHRHLGEGRDCCFGGQLRD